MFDSRFFEKDRAVQERWFRMVFQKKFGRQIRALFRWNHHRKLKKEFYKKEQAINNAIETTVKGYRKVNEDLFPATKQFFNIGLFFLLAERDVQSLKADALAHPNETKRNIALRTLLLTIYEWDMGKVTGRRMQSIYESTGLSESSKWAIVNALKELKKARKAIEAQLSETRHNTIAHREADAMLQYKIISELDIMSFSTVLTDFYAASDKLLKAMIPAMLEIGKMKSMLNQAVYRTKSSSQSNKLGI